MRLLPESYLTDRKSIVQINAAASKERPVTTGVPECSVLVHYCSLYNCSANCSVLFPSAAFFADDLKLVFNGSGNDLNNCRKT